MNEHFPIMTPRRGVSSQVLTVNRIPWAMIAPHEAQALKNHCGQTLARLAERGGLSAEEALAVLEDRPWQPMASAAAHVALFDRVGAWKVANP